MDFTDRVIWITGASSGIGEALTYPLAAAGARLILSSRRAEELERVRQRCRRPEAHLTLPLDLAQPGTFAAAVQQVHEHFGSIDVLVNNGGVSQRATALETTAAVERVLMDIDYFGPVALTKAVLPAMLARRSGHIVVVSSVMGYVGTPRRSTYAAAKHALHGYFDSLRAELDGQGVAITLVCPGYVRTAVSTHALGPTGEAHGRMDETQARGIPAERCAAAIVRALAHRPEEIAVGGREVLGIYLKRFAPKLLSRIVRRM
jgi:short-subunit dehydrogenase